MKIKTDFVTNSSSSSFIVFWPHKIVKEEDVSKHIKREDFIPIIFQDAKKQKPLIIDKDSGKPIIQKIADELDNGWVEGLDGRDTWNYDKKFCAKHGITQAELSDNFLWRQQLWQEQELLKTQQAVVMATDLVEKYEGNYAYFFEYGDEDGALFSDLEHENNWGGLPHVRISKH